MNIRIGSFKYKLCETTQPLLLNHQECIGIIDYENFIIQIQKNINQQRKNQTILHELFHGILKEYNIEIANIDEETLVDSLGTAMYQVIKDNPKLIDYIRKED